MEIKYKEYLKFDDKVKIINGQKYYKIIDCHISERFGILIVPFEAVPKSNIWLIDENGFKFLSKGLVHIRFSGNIPDWYFKVATICVDVVKPETIGEFVKIWEA